MYSNIGGKIKGLAVAFAILGTLISVVYGIMIMFDRYTAPIYGLLLLFLGPVVSWVASWLLYGFGEITDKLCAIERNTRPGGPFAPAAPASPLEGKKEDLKRVQTLSDLLAKGLITEQEYQTALINKERRDQA